MGGRREAGAFRPRHVLPGQKCEPGPSHISPVPPLHRGAVEGQGRQDCVRQKKGVSAGWLLKYSLELEKISELSKFDTWLPPHWKTLD